MACYIGIHAGNSSACVAVGKSGKVSVVANSHGDRLTPSMVTFTADETLVGFSSKQVSHRYIPETVKQFNHVLGKSLAKDSDAAEDADLRNRLGVDMEKLQDGKLAYVIKNNGKRKSFTPEKILELLMGNLLETAMSQAGPDANEVVITAPIGCSESYLEAVNNAASNAGFDVLRIISEPAAACLAYGIASEKNDTTSQNILVFRVGGVSQDVTLLSSNSGILSVEEYVVKKSGGDILTDIIAKHFAALFKKKFRVDITSNVKSMNKLKINAENCKHILSAMPAANCHIDSLYDGFDFSCSLSRSMFEMLASEHLQNLVNPLKDLVSNLDLGKSVIDKVILSGGTCSIPRLQNLVSDIFPDAELLSTIPPSEVNAVGAAVEAGLLISQDACDVAEDELALSLSPVDIYLKFGDKRNIVVNQRTVLPFSVKRQYTFPENQTEVMLQLCLADPIQDENNIVLGSATITSSDKSEAELMCEVKYSRIGNISVSYEYATISGSFTVSTSS